MSQQSQKNTPQRILDTSIPTPGRSWFNRGYVNNWSACPGRAIPVFCKHIPANTKVKLGIKSKFESFPSLTPLKSNYIMDFQAFFCPTRLYVPELRANDIKSVGAYYGENNVDEVSDIRFPVLEFSQSPTLSNLAVAPRGGVLNRLGLPAVDFNKLRNLKTSADLYAKSAVDYMNMENGRTTRKNAIPWLAYLDIWCRNYANVNEPDVPVENYRLEYYDGQDDNTNLNVEQRIVKLRDLQSIVSAVGFGREMPDVVSGVSIGKIFDVNHFSIDGWNPFRCYMNSAQGVRYFANSVFPQGLLPTTYMPDYFSTWINSDAYDKANVALDAGSLSVSTIRIAQRKFMSLAKQLFSKYTYTDWNYTQYGASLKLCDYPIFVGKDRVVFNFDTLRSQAETGALKNGYIGAGVGIAKSGQVSKPIKFESEEDGYLLVIASLTPEVNYYNGHDKFWDYLGMDDVPLPAYDAVGFQDLLRGELYTDFTAADDDSVGKVPYAYELMSSVNRSNGLMQTEAFRSWVNNREDVDPTTYVDPARFNYNFVNIGQNEDNFVIDTLFSFSAKQPFSKQLLNFNR